MNFLFAIIDSIVEWIRRNPLTSILLVMIAVFAPGLYGAIFIGIDIVILLLLAIPIFGIFKLRRMSRKMEEQANQTGQQQQRQGFGGFGGHGFGKKQNNEGEVKVYTTTSTPEKRVSDDVGEYVDFEEVKK